MTRISYFRIIGLLICFFAGGETALSQETKIRSPKWFIDPPTIKGKLVAMSSGTSVYEALTVALVNLAKQSEQKVESLNKSYSKPEDDSAASGLTTLASKALTETSFGKVKVSYVSKSFAEEMDESSSTFDQTMKICYESGGKELMLKYYCEEIGLGEKATILSSFSIVSQDCTFRDLRMELGSRGIEIETTYVDDYCYVMLTKDLPRNPN